MAADDRYGDVLPPPLQTLIEEHSLPNPAWYVPPVEGLPVVLPSIESEVAAHEESQNLTGRNGSNGSG